MAGSDDSTRPLNGTGAALLRDPAAGVNHNAARTIAASDKRTLSIQSAGLLPEKETPVDLREKPVALKETPSALKETPSALKETPSALKEMPSALKEMPSALKEMPSALKEIPISVRKPPFP